MVFSFFSFLNRKYPFWINLVQKFKIVSLNRNLNFEYVKVNDDVHLFCFRPFFASFVEKILLAFWRYLINLPAVYSRRREANDFSYFS